jgi:FKBP-type peptidyl-prolyl cis-trans isomerase (trigger factor)
MKWEHAKSDSENGYHRLIVEADWSEIAPDYDDIVAEYAKVPIAGFRADKIPMEIVEKRFQKKITEALSRRCAQQFGREALRQSGSEAAGPLEVSDIECLKGKPFRFTVRFLALPDFDLPDLQSIRIPEESENPLSELSHRLLEQVSMRLPDELVRAELAVDGEDTAEPGSDEWAAAAERVKLMLILKKIARREGIEVDESDVESRIREKASEFGTTVEMLREQLEKGGGRERLRDMLVAENTLGYLVETVQR